MNSSDIYNRDEIIEYTGSAEGGWNWIEDWFANKSKKEILAECDRVWPTDENEKLANSIYEELDQQKT